MPRREVILPLAMALIFSTIQCAAACVVDVPAQASAPPCHKHHSQAPAPCGHHIVSVASSPSAPVVPAMALPLPPSVMIDLPALPCCESGISRDFAEARPPGANPDLLVLRI